ncbi:nucleotidyltransferase family protein [Bacillus sp. FJAT-22090]|uniref:nucleotidyltransferase family protein n=1 Tax=Bacillus sp. FJAT-22090 TaxID=1581038 RepID=UPI0011A9D0CC|nr:nucleotidyltransferase family protein [Bacillus sp. FJAT-22090]
MKLENTKDITRLIEADHWMMDILRVAKGLNLPDWWICAGFVRSKIWDALHSLEERTSVADIDVIYFDSSNVEECQEKKLEERLKDIAPNIPWSVKNQARMHHVNNLPAYSSAVDGIAKFPETVTALGVKLDDKDKVILTAPYGVKDVLQLKVRPTPLFLTTKELKDVYMERVRKKDWASIWNKLKIYYQ